MIKFSLVITTYNSEKYVEEAIKSVIKQVRIPDEIIICDDNSSDNTISICNKYQNYITIHINRNGPSGYTKAFNYALKLGTGDYISILHFDDILHPNFFSQAELGFRKYPSCRFLISQNFYFGDKKYDFIPMSEDEETFLFLKGDEYTKSYLNGVKINKHINRCPGTIFHRTLTNQIKFREEVGLISDDDLFYRVGGLTDVLRIVKPLVGVRMHSDSESGKLDNLRLSYALSKGYYFLAKDWEKKTIIGQEGLEFFLNSFFKHNFRTLYWACVQNKLTEINSAVCLNEKIVNKYHNQAFKYFNFYQRLFFMLAGYKLLFIDKYIFFLHYKISNWKTKHL